jgi:hypothetical protein
MSFVVWCNHSWTPGWSARSASDVVSRNHSRAGDVIPLCMPDASVRAANVAVASMMSLLRRSPLLRP